MHGNNQANNKISSSLSTLDLDLVEADADDDSNTPAFNQDETPPNEDQCIINLQAKYTEDKGK